MSTPSVSPAPASPPHASSALDRAVWILALVCVALALGDLAVTKHPHFAWEGYFAFNGAFGFAAYAFIVFAGRALRRLVMRPETYYE